MCNFPLDSIALVNSIPFVIIPPDQNFKTLSNNIITRFALRSHFLVADKKCGRTRGASYLVTNGQDSTNDNRIKTTLQQMRSKYVRTYCLYSYPWQHTAGMHL